MAQSMDCSVCNIRFAELDIPIKCNSCSLPVHSKCTKLSAMELKCLGMKNGSLKYFCDACDQGLKELPELKAMLRKLLFEVESLKNSHTQNNAGTQFDSEFIINEINERNKRASNLILYNINESDSTQSDLRITHDLNQVNIVIKSILNNATTLPSPVKVIRLGRSQSNKPRPLKVVFNSVSDVFDILKNKRNLSIDHPNVSVSSDRTQIQRDYMQKLREQLTTRSSNGENGLTIKFIKGVPKIINKSELVDNSSKNIKPFF